MACPLCRVRSRTLTAEDRAYLASSRNPLRKRKVGDSYIENGVSYVQIYKKMKTCDEGSADYHHRNDPYPTCIDMGYSDYHLQDNPDPTCIDTKSADYPLRDLDLIFDDYPTCIDTESADYHLRDPDPKLAPYPITPAPELAPYPSTEHTEEENRPPYIIAVQGPPRVGKTLLIKSLVEFYTESSSPLDMAAGPIRILAGNKRRIQFVECPNNVNGMIDAAKYADAVIFLIDGGYGFEMETFEFLQLLRVHGMPKVMGVLTYLDTYKNKDMLAKTRQLLLDQFQTEICEGAPVFCLSGLDNKMYFKHEIAKLATYISTMEFHPLSWRAARPYLLVDRFEDVTSKEIVQIDEECPRNIILEGYLRGCHLEKGTEVHIAGVGDFPLASIRCLADPFPLQSVASYHECYRAGTYVCLEICNVPSVMVKKYDPCQPILVGGITVEEQDVGHIQVKLELHSWNLKSLKSKDPIIISVGWRRYQTRPIYALKDRHGSYGFLKCTPKNRRCYAVFLGPRAPPDTGLAIVQSLADKKAAFRFLAKACVVGVDQAPRIFKKSKRIGTPCKISKETAFIKDMFTSDLEIANFKDARVWTASGICGKIIKPAGKDLIRGLASKDGQPREGIVECTFKRKISKWDTVFMRVKVDVPCFLNTIMTGPVPPDRIWNTRVNTSGSQLPVPADYYKGHTAASKAELNRLRKMQTLVMLLNRFAITEDEKNIAKSKSKELTDAYDKSYRELTSTLRRQTLEQLRAVRFLEGQMEQKVTEIQRPLMSEEKRAKLIKEFEEYLKEEEGMSNVTADCQVH